MIFSKVKEKIAIRNEIKKSNNIINSFLKTFTEVLFEHGVFDSLDNTITPYDIEIISGSGAKGITCKLKFPNGLSFNQVEKCIPAFRENLYGRCMVFLEDQVTYVRLTTVNKWFKTDFKKEITSSPLHVFLGYDVAMKPININFAKSPHMLITGSSGGGKSKLVEVLISNMAMQWNKSELELYFIQVGKSDQYKYELLEHCLGCVTSSSKTESKGCLELAIDLITYLYERLLERENEVLKVIKRSDEDINLDIYNKKAKKKMPATFILIDEASTLFEDNGTKEEKKLKETARHMCAEVAKRGRFVGMNLIVSQQRATKDELPRSIKINCNTQLTFNQTDARASEVAIGDSISALGLSPQVFVYKSGSSTPYYGKTPQSNWTTNVNNLKKLKRTRRDKDEYIKGFYSAWLKQDTKDVVEESVLDYRSKLEDLDFKNATKLKESISKSSNHHVKVNVDNLDLSRIYQKYKK